LPELNKRLGRLSKQELMSLAEKAGIPFGPVNRPSDLVDDLHMNESGSLAEVKTSAGDLAKLPKLPLRMDGASFDLRSHPPQIGEGSRSLYRELGFSDREIEELESEKIVQIKE
jgi:crotonobetainyl-CoA:carnitine CoA-transferase CaiB-like acyl-CoA transferase